MTFAPRFVGVVLLILVVRTLGVAQAENVPVGHPVYDFLKRMEVKGAIDRYHDAVLPLSRKNVAGFLERLNHNDDLTAVEQASLNNFMSEFQFDVEGSISRNVLSLIESTEPTLGDALLQTFSNREKYMYAYADTNLSFFVNALLNVDMRRISGDALGKEHTEYFQFGGRIRGTVYGKLGYYLQGTNAQFWGSRELLQRDKVIGQLHTIQDRSSQNFDMSEGYVRYDGGFISAEVGTERLVWGIGYDQSIVISDNIRPFPFIRMDAEYKSLKYTFVHGWLLGNQGVVLFSLPSDSSTTFAEPTIADKYIVGHRLEFSFPGLFDIGGQEVVIYSNRSVDLAYLTPLIVLESAQRARGERDNNFWIFDFQTHFLRGMELSGSLLMDDIHFSEFFSNKWYNRNAYQFGLYVTDPLFFPNVDLAIQWTRVEPYVFAHDRSRDNSYSSLGRMIGPQIGPNADSWFFRSTYVPRWNLKLSLSVTLTRHGENIVDATGKLVRNVGGDFLQPHRPADPQERIFLDGILVKTRRVEFLATYEIRNQMWLDGWYLNESIRNTSLNTTEKNQTVGGRVRLEF